MIFILFLVYQTLTKFKVSPILFNEYLASLSEKDLDNQNQAGSYESATDLSVTNTFSNNHQSFENFFFPKEFLVKQYIHKTATSPAIRSNDIIAANVHLVKKTSKTYNKRKKCINLKKTT